MAKKLCDFYLEHLDIEKLKDGEPVKINLDCFINRNCLRKPLRKTLILRLRDAKSVGTLGGRGR
mgnify:CR=1 FL=1